MAYRDLRASLANSEQVQASAEEKRLAQIQRVFFEVAQENGLADTEFFTGPSPEEASVVVYDKFMPPQH